MPFCSSDREHRHWEKAASTRRDLRLVQGQAFQLLSQSFLGGKPEVDIHVDNHDESKQENNIGISQTGDLKQRAFANFGGDFANILEEEERWDDL